MIKFKPSKNEKGITLIALIVMIIVLVIIAAVVVRMISDKNGLMTATTNTAENHTISSYKEQIMTKVQSSIVSYTSKGQVIDLLQLATEINRRNTIRKISSNKPRYRCIKPRYTSHNNRPDTYFKYIMIAYME